MKLSKLCGDHTPITVQDEDTLALALQVMIWGGIRHLPVMHGTELAGVLSERDVLRRYAEVGKRAGRGQKVGNAMTSPPVTVTDDDNVEAAVRLVTERGVGCLPVLHGRRLVGIVTRHDLLREELEHDEAPAGQPWTELTVDDVMSVAPITASADDELLTAVERMEAGGIRHLPVIDGERRVVGMLSDRDVRTAIGNPRRAIDRHDAEVRIRSLRVEHAMTRRPLILAWGTRLSRAAALFADHKVGAIPIVDDQERIVGIVSYLDVLRAVLGRRATAS